MMEDEFTPEYDRLVGQYEKLAAMTAAIQREKEDKEYRARRISLFMRILAGQEECLRWCSWRRWLSAGRKRACILHLNVRMLYSQFVITILPLILLESSAMQASRMFSKWYFAP